MFEIDWKGLALPFAYVIVLASALMTFSTIYRKRKSVQSANVAPWFGPSLQRNIYLSLVHMTPEDSSEKTPKIPDSVLRAALLRRAVEDVKRLVQIKEAQRACGALLQRGSVGDVMSQRLERADNELQLELRDVAEEANALAPGWGASIFKSAEQMYLNTQVRAHLDGLLSQAETERQWWDKERESTGTVEAAPAPEQPKDSPTKSADEDAVIVDTPKKTVETPVKTGGGRKKGKGRK